MIATKRPTWGASLVPACLLLAGCVSFGAEPPESLLTLTPSASVSAGSGAVAGSGEASSPIAVLTPEVPARLDVVRIPVKVSDTELAYLKNAHWVEKPARLFRQLIGETLRSATADGTPVLILDTADTPTLATRYVRGTLIDMTYDAATSSAVVRFDAIHTMEDGTVMSRRFEARESGVLPEAASVGPALNRAANEVAREVAAWVLAAG